LNSNRNNRRRGRGNRNQGGGGNQSNRIDSRARGNAPQLLEKYKKLAQDAQHNGDRVQTEYYLQFADHYFRVISDNKARQEEARAKRSDNRGDKSGDGRAQANDDGDDESERENRRAESKRSNRRQRSRRDDDGVMPSEGESGIEGEAAGEDESARPKRRTRKPKADDGADEERPAARRKPRVTKRKSGDGDEGAGESGEIDSAVLPPAIKAEESDDDNLKAVG